MKVLRLSAVMGALLPVCPVLADNHDALGQMWHEMAQTEYGAVHGEAYAAALADCVLAVFADLNPADRDILAEHAMNPPEPDASRIEALLPGHAEQMLACGDTVRPEDFAN